MNLGTNTIFMGWNRAIAGRELSAAEHFGELIGWLGGLQAAGQIDSFDPVFLSTHGGDLNGFVVIKGSTDHLNDLEKTEDWVGHVVRGGLNMQNFGVVRGASGDAIQSWMSVWTEQSAKANA